eukprot:CAMPEP_0179944206 /NCGR_PEP_ID=MMETSP0983-20121128/18843_1 /TAXON_ID=483367 /ORGANISM="non described non described, Strain CCMP 2436" /LENGTH=52 /DNA_ID=CAMNT_0021852193 /DNA_START=205 /DNA_END=363 /DNA_ORIENTATION=+
MAAESCMLRASDPRASAAASSPCSRRACTLLSIAATSVEPAARGVSCVMMTE